MHRTTHIDPYWDRLPETPEEHAVCNVCSNSAVAHLKTFNDAELTARYAGPDSGIRFRNVVVPIVLTAFEMLGSDEWLLAHQNRELIRFLQKHQVDWGFIADALHVLASVDAIKVASSDDGKAIAFQASTLIELRGKEPILATNVEVAPTTTKSKFDPKYCVFLKPEFCLSPIFDELILGYAHDVHRHFELRERKDTLVSTKKALSVVLGNLYRAHQRDPNLAVALSLSGNSYRSGGRNPMAVSYRGIDRVVEYLRDTKPPLIAFKAGANNKKRGSSFYSRVKATETLISSINNYNEGPLASQKDSSRITNDTSSAANSPYLVASLFENHELPVIRLRDVNKRDISFEETNETKRMHKELVSWNKYQKTQWIDLILPNEDFLQATNRPDQLEVTDEFGKVSTKLPARVDIVFERDLYRVFNNGSFDEGGRLYGGWWQTIASEWRKFITINWVPTKELDFSNMQAAMLYAKEGKKFVGDAYSIDGIPKSYRKLVKRTFFKLINAKGNMKAPLKSELPDGWTWKQLRAAIAEKHAAIAKYLNSGVGIELQRVDSDIAMQVIKRLQAADILALPVHDSFVTYEGSSEKLRTTMANVYRETMQSEIGIDADPAFLDQYEIPGEDGFDPENEVAKIEKQPEYSSYLSRKKDFLSRQSDEWKWKYCTG